MHHDLSNVFLYHFDPFQFHPCDQAFGSDSFSLSLLPYSFACPHGDLSLTFFLADLSGDSLPLRGIEEKSVRVHTEEHLRVMK